MSQFSLTQRLSCLCLLLMLGACQNVLPPELPAAKAYLPATSDPEKYEYLLGPGDQLSVFVWRNPDLTAELAVRPDGKITMPLVEDVYASGKTPTQLAIELEERLRDYIREPIVTINVLNFTGPYREQVRVLGEATQPRALAYRENMTLLDAMIAVGGLTEFADGDRARLIRVEEGAQQQYTVRLESLLRDGDISANVDLLPGDTLIIPEAWF